MISQMIRFMKGLNNVEHLTLKFHFSLFRKRPILGLPPRAGVPLIDISVLLQQPTFPRLSHLTLGLCSFHEEAFVAFMQRHRKQLKSLKGIRLNLVGESCSWRSAIQRIAPVMSLDVVHLRCLLDDEIMTVKDADVFRVLTQYNRRASLYLKLNGRTEYPSLSALASTAPLNPFREAEMSHVFEI